MTVPFDPFPPFQEYARPERLVSASWLSARLGTPGLRVVESDEDTLLYDIGHLPGAVRIDWKHDLNDPITRDLVDGEAFSQLMRDKGINRDDTVVIYGDQSNWWASYTLWVFEIFGHADVRLLDGGRNAWMAEERDTSFIVPEFPKSNYPSVERNDTQYRALVTEVLSAIDAETIIDVRSPDEFAGVAETTDYLSCGPALRSGHIPSAKNYPWTDTMHPNSRFRSRADLEQIYAGLDPHGETFTYCHLGDQSSHTWFTLKYLLGFKNVRNYDGSWAEWGNMIQMPISRGE
ncbi:sulfurtransferase [Corynebacterium alimapuense]|uniref:Sulfurtransferase n=1 Tax=Corynebacterium alimapuense TaxID=1576874 RepID=A0A3M8K7Q4_9CORY|nr:sulfurtransferase [Corynebacterium alimapuense]RNE48785.1 sulfurtransferase [Corynebacterium alimapuense]